MKITSAYLMAALALVLGTLIVILRHPERLLAGDALTWIVMAAFLITGLAGMLIDSRAPGLRQNRSGPARAECGQRGQ